MIQKTGTCAGFARCAMRREMPCECTANGSQSPLVLYGYLRAGVPVGERLRGVRCEVQGGTAVRAVRVVRAVREV